MLDEACTILKEKSERSQSMLATWSRERKHLAPLRIPRNWGIFSKKIGKEALSLQWKLVHQKWRKNVCVQLCTTYLQAGLLLCCSPCNSLS